MKKHNEFGSRLAQIRNQRGLSLSKLAKLAAVSKAHLHDLEKGRAQNPSVVTLLLIAGALEASADEFARLALNDAYFTFGFSGGLKTRKNGHAD